MTRADQTTRSAKILTGYGRLRTCDTPTTTIEEGQ